MAVDAPMYHHQQPVVYTLQAVHNGCTVLPLSESSSSLCLCFQTRMSAASQQVQYVSVHIICGRVRAALRQSGRCKLSQLSKANSYEFLS